MARVVNSVLSSEIRGDGQSMKPGWSLDSYPRVDKSRIDRRPQIEATERMLWRRDHSLACPVGGSFAEEDLPLLMTWAEFQEEK